MQLAWKVAEGSKVKLKDYDPDYLDKHTDRALASAELEKLSEELGELQELLSAAQHHSLLIVLQGMDTSGKDGTIRQVMSHVNPLGCEVRSFKGPTLRDQAHDFLWRIHRVTPGRGMISIFNRSHYEDVLVVRVHNLVPKQIWKRRYATINDFEHMLAQNDMIILKFYLHISNEEQERRLLARQEEKTKAWKLSSADWEERKYWNDYQAAYEDALSKCSTDEAPWYIVPANRKWYRNLLVARTIVRTLRPYKKQWMDKLVARGERELALIERLQGVAG
ncbi:MAG TPA: PPK2 family polyphosphate kinase [Ktedonobacteraceae bacterium]|jgi:PPK2 family polyphosphate:nucleotide phosphotransferase|nr:PPK2 family polyphosphate kinase [Ktedonobacteraceae bacterium]